MFKPDYTIRLKVNRSYFTTIEDQFDGNLHALEDYTDTQPIIFDTIPAFFTNLDEYPINTNLLCWNCDRSFTKRPIFISPSVREINGHMEFAVDGNFCSFNCAYSWITAHYNGDAKDKMIVRLIKLCEIFTGHSQQIEPAFSKTLQKKYGGKYSEIRYAELMETINPERIIKKQVEIKIEPRLNTISSLIDAD
jgi:hypothetical protein